MAKEGKRAQIFPFRFEFWSLPESPHNCEQQSQGKRDKKQKRLTREGGSTGAKEGERWGEKWRKSKRWREWKFPSPNIVAPSRSLISN